MLNAELSQILRSVPTVVAIFRVTKVPDWASEILEVGDEVYWNASKDSMITLGKFGQPNGKKSLKIGASYLKFERFATV